MPESKPWVPPDIRTNRFDSECQLSTEAAKYYAALIVGATAMERVLLSLPQGKQQEAALMRLEESVMWARLCLSRV